MKPTQEQVQTVLETLITQMKEAGLATVTSGVAAPVVGGLGSALSGVASPVSGSLGGILAKVASPVTNSMQTIHNVVSGVAIPVSGGISTVTSGVATPLKHTSEEAAEYAEAFKLLEAFGSEHLKQIHDLAVHGGAHCAGHCPMYGGMQEALSFDDIRKAVSSALDARFPRTNTESGMSMLSSGWNYIEEMYPDAVIYSRQGKTYKLPYAMMGTDVTLGDTEIEVTEEWTAVKEAARKAQEAAQPPKTQPPKTAPPKEVPLTETAGSIQLHETTPTAFNSVQFGESEETPVIKGVVIIQPGQSANRKNYSDAVIKRDCKEAFEGAPVFATQHVEGEKNARNLTGKLANVSFKEGVGAVADLQFLAAEASFAKKLQEAHEMFGPRVVGLSINTSGHATPKKVNNQTIFEVERIYRSQRTSVDIVTYPAAGGRLAEATEETDEMKGFIERLTAAKLQVFSPAALKETLEGVTDDDIRAANPSLAEAVIAKRDGQERTPADPAPQVQQEAAQGQGATLTEAQVEELFNKRMRLIECKSTLAAKLNEAKMSALGCELVRSKFTNADGSIRLFEDSELDAVIVSTRDLEARSNPNLPYVPGTTSAQVVQEAHDLHRLRLEAFFRQNKSGGADLQEMFPDLPLSNAKVYRAVKDAKGHTVEPYRSFRWEILPQMAGVNCHDPRACREAMGSLAWNGDLIRNQERLQESVLDSTFDQAWADVLNRVLLDAMLIPELNTWRLWTRDVSFQDLTHTKKFVRFGGYADFPTVGQGAPYQPVTTPADEQVAFVPSKYGGTEQITWEGVLADDVGLISRIPISLGIAWAGTIYNTVYAVLQANAAMDYDSTALYNARTLTNIVDSALSATSLETARKQMAKMVELSSSRRLLIKPKFLLYAAPDLDQTAFELLGQNAKNTTNEDSTKPNFFFGGNPGGGIVPVPVVYPTATTQRWELVADPATIETLLVGFLGGNSNPEVMVQDLNVNAGAAFTSDQITYKLRGTCGAKAANHRAFQRGQTT